MSEESQENNSIYSAIEEKNKIINSEIKRCLMKLNTKEDTKDFRAHLSRCYFKRGCNRLEQSDFVRSMYDLTLSLQYHVTSLCFYKRGELFAKLEFYEQALADFVSSYEYSTIQNDKKELEKRIVKLKKALEEQNA